MQTLWQDLRYGARMLLRNTIFTVVAALTLALGIGVNTTIFTLFYSVALRPLPVKDPEGVVNVYQTFTGENSRRVSGNRYLLSYPEYVNYRDQTRVFEKSIDGTRRVTAVVRGEDVIFLPQRDTRNQPAAQPKWCAASTTCA